MADQHTNHPERLSSRVIGSVIALGLLIPIASTYPAYANGELYVETEGVGIGIPNPQRLLHISGNNAVFRMDRDIDTAAFLLVRTASDGTPLKTFVVGTNASGENDGEFIINDLGAAAAGAGPRRMTITNDGDTHFTGTVHAPAFVQTSTALLKEDIQTLRDASHAVQQLRGVRFSWKDSGEASIGMIAEEVQSIYPELVKIEDGEAVAVNYSAFVAILVEAHKEQSQALSVYRSEIADQQARIARLEAQVADHANIRARLKEIENLLSKGGLQTATVLK